MLTRLPRWCRARWKRLLAAKVAAARDLWVPAVNNAGRYGRWSFLEVTDPWDAANLIRSHVAELATERTEAIA